MPKIEQVRNPLQYVYKSKIDHGYRFYVWIVVQGHIFILTELSIFHYQTGWHFPVLNHGQVDRHAKSYIIYC